MPRYLGLDSSTQSLSAVVVDTDTGKVVLDDSVAFGTALPEYASPNGFLDNADARVRQSNPLMWVDALERLLEGAKARGFDWGSVASVSGAGQQHGSVYLSTPIANARPWSKDKKLAEQVAPLLSRKTSPIWMDSSTSVECREIAAAVGGDDIVTRVTGSRAIERFTGPQIRKFWKDDPLLYERTAEIHLVSSFMAALLTGKSAPIDYGDGAGMNLLELASLGWNEELLAATAPNLADKLRRPVASATVVGPIAPYFVEKFGFKGETPVVAFTGDNPSSLVGMGATEPGTAVVSLGTSDTVFAAMRAPKTDPRGFGHVFGNPAGGFMCLICYSNGSLAREAVAKKVGLDWQGFERAILEGTRPGNSGNLMLPFFGPEITPRLPSAAVKLFGIPDFVAWRAPAEAARAVVEAQALSMLRHSDWIGEKPSQILVTGGASKNRGILQVVSDVFQAELRTLSVANSSALGGALRAANAVGGYAFAELRARFSAPDGSRSVRPSPGSDKAYDTLRKTYAEKLAELLG
jgi:xylulokinase